jgi:hypothetical protein
LFSTGLAGAVVQNRDLEIATVVPPLAGLVVVPPNSR